MLFFMVYLDCNHYNVARRETMQHDEIIALFKKMKFRATPQRIAVFDYVSNHKTHPDVLEIYDNVLSQNPNFSKTTVYNALKALTDKGLLMVVSIDGERIRYDADTSIHGHFRCKDCGKIYDFKVDNVNYELPSGFIVHQKDVYYSGLCPDCSNK